MRIVNLLDSQGSSVSPKVHIDSVFSTDGTSLGSKLKPVSSGVEVTGNVTATTFIGSLQGNASTATTATNSTTATTANSTAGTLTLIVDGVSHTFNGSSNQSISWSSASSAGVSLSTSTGTRYLVGSSGTSGTMSTGYVRSDVYVNSSGSIYSNGFYVSSAREKKENIRFCYRDPLSIIMDTQIYDFNYKDDKSKKPKVGIIADEAPELLVTTERDGMDTGNTIGVLLLAVQHLVAKVTELEGRLNAIHI